MTQEYKDPGWRKLAVWALVYFMIAYIVVLGRVNNVTGELLDVPPNAERILTWVTSGFFIMNGTVHSIRAGAAAFAAKK